MNGVAKALADITDEDEGLMTTEEYEVSQIPCPGIIACPSDRSGVCRCGCSSLIDTLDHSIMSMKSIVYQVPPKP